MSTKNKLETASVLAFNRNFDISDATFYQQNSNTDEDTMPIIITRKSVRGTISNRLKNATANDPLKLDAELEKANLQKIDVAMLDSDKDTLVVEWTCKVLPFDGTPSVCNNMAYQQQLVSTIQTYIKEHGFSELALRYATNVLNGRWLWRNRISAESIAIEVTPLDINHHKNQEPIVIADCKQLSLVDFTDNQTSIKQLANLIEAGLSGKSFVIFKVKAKLAMGWGQEVYPSQELILEKYVDKNHDKSKVLYSKKDNQAAMHSQKIGNAIRTIDTWYDDMAEFPIAIEPYGTVTTMGHAFRQPQKKMDFYTLFDDWIIKGQKPDISQQHYIVGVLIRGGVFGATSKE
jgi:CRISPR-associated protein Csy3